MPGAFTTIGHYGKIRANTNLEVPAGFVVYAGRNNAGKSSILQFIYKRLFEQANVHRRASYCFIGPDRAYVNPHLPPATTLEALNQDLYNEILNNPKTFEGVRGGDPARMYSLFLHKDSLLDQVNAVNVYLIRMGLTPLTIREGQRVTIDNVDIHKHGSGVRAVLPILAALTSGSIETVILDEPEISLEARAQKVLKEIFVESAASGKNIIIATQSHLFLNRAEIGKNFTVASATDSPWVQINRLQEQNELLDLTYNLLGNSLEDLFFPNNFLIVEGVSDQVICERVSSLLGHNSTEVKIISARGIDNVPNAYNAIEQTLIPIIANNSPYSKRVLVIVDKPNADNTNRVETIRKTLGDRLVVLSKESIEEYLPEALYRKAGRVKDDDLKKLTLAMQQSIFQSKGYEELFKLKKEISSQIALSLQKEDLDLIPEIKEAVTRAYKNSLS